MKRLALTLLAALALWSTPSPAQQPITLPANTVYGRLGVGPGPGQAIPFATLSPFLGSVAGPGSSTVGAIPTWSNTLGTALGTGILPGALNNCLISNGTAWTSTPCIGGREKLLADRTYFVNQSAGSTGNCNGSTCQAGSNSNSGLTIGAPFLTIQKAYNTICQSIDLAGFNVTVQLTDGNYTENNSTCPYVGRGTTGHTGPVMTQGNASTPTSVSLQPAAGNAVTCTETGGLEWEWQNLKFAPPAGSAILADAGCWAVSGPGITVGATTSTQYTAQLGGFLEFTAAPTITGGAAWSILVLDGGKLVCSGSITSTVTGTPAFSSGFLGAFRQAEVQCPNLAYSGAATGTRWQRDASSLFLLSGPPDSVFPGNANGSITTPWTLAESGLADGSALPSVNTLTIANAGSLKIGTQSIISAAGNGAGNFVIINDAQGNQASAIGATSDPTYYYNKDNIAFRTSSALEGFHFLNTKVHWWANNAGNGSVATTVGTCGTSPTISGTDAGGEITTGSTATTSCILTFAVAYTGVPYCVATPVAAANSGLFVTPATGTLTFTYTSATSLRIAYQCMARTGG